MSNVSLRLGADKPKRQTNIEVLRIIAMTMILIHHYIYHGLKFSPVGNYEIYPFLKNTFDIGVNIFFIISGWFSIKASVRGVVQLLCYILAAIVLSFVALTIVGKTPRVFDVIVAILTFFCNNNYWFIQVYLLLIVISPIINAGIERIPLRQFNIIVLVMTLFMVIDGWIFAASYIKLFHNLTQGLWTYLLGRCLWLNRECLLKIRWYWLLLIFSVTFVIDMGIRPLYFYYWDIPLVYSPLRIFSSCSLFLLFAKWKVKTIRVINYIAGCALGCYVIQDSIFSFDYYYNVISERVLEAISHLDNAHLLWFLIGDCALEVLRCWIMALIFIPPVRWIADKLAAALTPWWRGVSAQS